VCSGSHVTKEISRELSSPALSQKEIRNAEGGETELRIRCHIGKALECEGKPEQKKGGGGHHGLTQGSAFSLVS